MTCGLTDIVNFCLAIGGIFLFTGTFGTLLYAIVLHIRQLQREDRRNEEV